MPFLLGLIFGVLEKANAKRGAGCRRCVMLISIVMLIRSPLPSSERTSGEGGVPQKNSQGEVRLT